MSALPQGWNESEWARLQIAQRKPADARSDEDWDIIDKPKIWPEEDAGVREQSEFYGLTPGQLDP